MSVQNSMLYVCGFSEEDIVLFRDSAISHRKTPEVYLANYVDMSNYVKPPKYGDTFFRDVPMSVLRFMEESNVSIKNMIN